MSHHRNLVSGADTQIAAALAMLTEAVGSLRRIGELHLTMLNTLSHRLEVLERKYEPKWWQWGCSCACATTKTTSDIP